MFLLLNRPRLLQNPRLFYYTNQLKQVCLFSKNYLFLFSDGSILKTWNTCNHSTPAQISKSLNREVQKILNEANISNIFDENSTLKLKLARYDQVQNLFWGRSKRCTKFYWFAQLCYFKITFWVCQKCHQSTKNSYKIWTTFIMYNLLLIGRVSNGSL